MILSTLEVWDLASYNTYMRVWVVSLSRCVCSCVRLSFGVCDCKATSVHLHIIVVVVAVRRKKERYAYICRPLFTKLNVATKALLLGQLLLLLLQYIEEANVNIVVARETPIDKHMYNKYVINIILCVVLFDCCCKLETCGVKQPTIDGITKQTVKHHKSNLII